MWSSIDKKVGLLVKLNAKGYKINDYFQKNQTFFENVIKTNDWSDLVHLITSLINKIKTIDFINLSFEDELKINDLIDRVGFNIDEQFDLDQLDYHLVKQYRRYHHHSDRAWNYQLKKVLPVAMINYNYDDDHRFVFKIKNDFKHLHRHFYYDVEFSDVDQEQMIDPNLQNAFDFEAINNKHYLKQVIVDQLDQIINQSLKQINQYLDQRLKTTPVVIFIQVKIKRGQVQPIKIWLDLNQVEQFNLDAFISGYSYNANLTYLGQINNLTTYAINDFGSRYCYQIINSLYWIWPANVIYKNKRYYLMIDRDWLKKQTIYKNSVQKPVLKIKNGEIFAFEIDPNFSLATNLEQWLKAIGSEFWSSEEIKWTIDANAKWKKLTNSNYRIVDENEILANLSTLKD